MYDIICIGIDQSYQRTGISIAADGQLLKVKSITFKNNETPTEKRKRLQITLQKVINSVKPKAKKTVCIFERIRLRSKGFLNLDYIKTMGALNAVIIDTCFYNDIPTYSVDTRAWKAQVVGTSKPKENKYGVPPEKWPTVQWVITEGFKSSITKEVKGRKTKGTFKEKGKKFEYDNDACDSAGIAMFYFLGKMNNLQEER